MKRTRIILFAVGAVMVGGFAALRHARVAKSSADSHLPAGPAQTVAATQSPVEIFQRAFWRRPTADDSILHADRREWSDAARNVQRWQWHLELRPSATLLAALRDPSTFGLLRARTVHAAGDSAAAPAWFPPPAQLTGCEILQGPAGGLTVYYRAADNTLFATDSGRGFAAPHTSLARR